MTSTALGRLEILREKNERFDFVNHDVYRLLYREDLYVMAYERIKSNAGYMTKGTDGTTLDSFSMRNVKSVISSLRDESYQPNPTRRVLIPKKNGKQRPLGIPSTTDKILQYVVKMILDSIYDSPNNPTFLECSHGFREGRSCHSALKEISNWNGTKWLIEGDIKGFFDNIDHKVLTNILKRRIDDDRFISLIHKFLNAGYVWKGTEYSTEVGTPQGGVISPVLANVYLHEFDIWINGISEKLTKGKKRGPNPEYRSVTRKRSYLLNKLEKAGLKPSLDDLALLNQYEKRMRELPSLDMNDPEFIRVRYVRYADDWLIGLVGDKTLANELKSRCTQFFREVLKLELSEEKTKITHNSDKAEFLGFYITT